MRSVPILCGLTLAAIVLATSSARADAIDGHWCAKDGRRLEIAGPTIVTPFGARVGGEYDRHHFSYIAPASDKNAGQKNRYDLNGRNGRAHSRRFGRDRGLESLRSARQFRPKVARRWAHQ